MLSLFRLSCLFLWCQLVIWVCFWLEYAMKVAVDRVFLFAFKICLHEVFWLKVNVNDKVFKTYFLKVLNQMFGPETNRYKEQNTLSSVTFVILSHRKAIPCTRQTWRGWISVLVLQQRANCASLGALSVHKFQQPVSSTAQKYQQFDWSLMFTFSWNCPIFVMNFCHRLICFYVCSFFFFFSPWSFVCVDGAIHGFMIVASTEATHAIKKKEVWLDFDIFSSVYLTEYVSGCWRILCCLRQITQLCWPTWKLAQDWSRVSRERGRSAFSLLLFFIYVVLFFFFFARPN